MALWEDAYEQQLNLWQWWGSDVGKRFARGYARAVETTGQDHERAGIVDGLPPGAMVASAQQEAAWLRDRLQPSQREFLLDGDPIAVDGDMMTMWEAASTTFEPEPLEATDLIVPAGFILLPRPWRTTDVWGKTLAIRALTWGPARFVERQTFEDQALASATPATTKFGNGILLGMYSRRGDIDDYWEGVRDFPGEWSLAHVTPWGYGSTYADVSGGLKEIAAGVQSLFRLLQQTIVLRTHELPSRPHRRRAAKADFPAKKVVVARLRRPTSPPRVDGPETERAPVQWSHRWLVSGHWRWQPYGPERSLRKQIWISPFVKGPEGKPLQMTSVHAFELVR